MSISKDRVEFSINYNRLNEKMFHIIEMCFGINKPALLRKFPNLAVYGTSSSIKIRCRPSQFARFIILRCDCELNNGIKELNARLINPVPVDDFIDVSGNQNGVYSAQ